MKFSEQWLREWTNPEISSESLLQQITMAGLEVDGVESVAPAFDNVVVAEVVAVFPHPNADKLQLCSVNDGAHYRPVVCGAPDVIAGMRVPLAKPGAELPNGIRVLTATIRGTESQGMLCSEQELGLAENSSGLFHLPKDAPLGKDLREYLMLDDSIIDVDLTPNRGDCLSILGLAREVATLNELVPEGPKSRIIEAVSNESLPVEILAPEVCPRYAGRVIKNVDLANKKSPVWMTEKLRRSGIRSIDPVVDVTNFVMLELGQPMHAFDLAQLKEGIEVRFPVAEEKLVLLDGQQISMRSDTLLIADKEKPLALAGIMGGEHSGVSAETKDIFLESAFFTPIALAGKARSYGLHTESSHRFERGVDSQHQARAIERATELLLAIVGGEPGPTVTVQHEDYAPEAPVIELRHHKVADLLGIHLNRTLVEDLLIRLGLTVSKITKDGWFFTVPSHRFDLNIEADLIEEIARIYGYNQLPTTKPLAGMTMPVLPESKTSLRRTKQLLVDLDYQEVITYSFVDPKLQAIVDPEKTSIELANPISADMSVMRSSLWTGLLKAAQYNQNRQQERIRLFESGLQFNKQMDEIIQKPVLAGLVSGPVQRENWADEPRQVDFFDVKGDLEKLLSSIGSGYLWERAEHPALHPGQSARIINDGQQVGTLGGLHPKIAKTLNLNGSAHIFELFLDSLAIGKVPFYKGLSRYPEIRRDIAVIVDETVSYSEVAKAVESSAGKWCVNHSIFDVYRGQSVGKGKKSLALGIVWRNSERTLRDEEISEALKKVVRELEIRFKASLRG